MKVSEIWRYPVKSMQGERLEVASVSERGLLGDRVWALRDEVKGGIRGAKKIPDLMKFRASYPVPPEGGAVVPAEITTPGGGTVMSDARDASATLTAALGREVTIWPLQPAADLDHYRRGEPDHEDLETELRELFALQADEGLPDLSKMPPEILEYESPPGTYFDAYPILLVSEESLARLAELLPESAIDVRRFRPNFLIADAAAGFPELDWVGKRLRVGNCELRVESECPRCVMTTLPFEDVPKDPRIMRALVREADHNLGVYASVVSGGEVQAGDPVELLGD